MGALADAGQAVEGTEANEEAGDGEPKSQNREDIDKAVEKIGQDVKVASQMDDHEAAHKQSTRILDVSKAVKKSAQAVASGPKADAVETIFVDVVPDADPEDAGKPTELKGGEEKALADAGQAVEGTEANEEEAGDGEPK